MRLMKYPVIGIGSIFLGYIIPNLWRFNIHNGEGLILALVVLVFWIVLPVLMLRKSITLIRHIETAQKDRDIIYLILPTLILALLLTALLITFFWRFK
jgi:hypothetical protein